MRNIFRNKAFYKHSFAIEGDIVQDSPPREKHRRTTSFDNPADWEGTYYQDWLKLQGGQKDTSNSKAQNSQINVNVNTGRKGFVPEPYAPKLNEVVSVWSPYLQTHIKGRVIGISRCFVASQNIYTVRPFGSIYADIRAPLSDVRAEI